MNRLENASAGSSVIWLHSHLILGFDKIGTHSSWWKTANLYYSRLHLLVHRVTRVWHKLLWYILVQLEVNQKSSCTVIYKHITDRFCSLAPDLSPTLGLALGVLFRVESPSPRGLLKAIWVIDYTSHREWDYYTDFCHLISLDMRHTSLAHLSKTEKQCKECSTTRQYCQWPRLGIVYIRRIVFIFTTKLIL